MDIYFFLKTIKARFISITINYIILGFQINLEQFYDSKMATVFMSKNFFGIKIRAYKRGEQDHSIIFSGKLILISCRKEEEIPEMAHYVKRMLLKFKR